MSGQRILIDTGAIYAFVTRTDAHHAAAVGFVRSWLDAKGSFVLGDFVFAETMTLLKARLGTEIALRVGTELRRNSAYSWIHLDAGGERDTWAIFQRFDDKEWSYTDCGLFALARREQISQIFAFDHHFTQMPELEMLPRSDPSNLR